MKLSTAIVAFIAFIAVSCVLAGPNLNLNLRRVRLSKAQTRLQSLHKSVRPLSTRPVLKSRHAEDYKFVSEQTVSLLSSQNLYVSARVEKGVTLLGGSPKIGESERFTLISLDDGKWAIRAPGKTGFVSSLMGGSGALVDVPAPLGGWCRYERINHADGTVSFKSVHGTYLRAEIVDNKLRIDSQTYIGAREKFTLVFEPREAIVTIKSNDGYFIGTTPADGPSVLSGVKAVSNEVTLSLLFLASGRVAIRTAKGAFLRVAGAGAEAKVDLVSKVEDAATFELLNGWDGYNKFKSSYGNYLRAELIDGKLRVDTQNYLGAKEQFVINYLHKFVRQQPAALKSFHENFVRVSSQAGVTTVDQTAQIGETEKLTLIFLESGKVAIRTPQGGYISVESAEDFSPLSVLSQIADSAIFDLIRNPDGTVTFKSAQGNYLRADEGGEGAAVNTQSYIGTWESFTVVDFDGNTLALN